MDRWKKSQRKSQKSQKKEDAGARKGRKAAKHYVFPMICSSGGSKSRLTKAAGAEPCGQMRDEKLHAKHISKSKVQNTPWSDPFWKLRVEMSEKCTPLWREAHLEVKCTKHLSVGACLEVEMSKNVEGGKYANITKGIQKERQMPWDCRGSDICKSTHPPYNTGCRTRGNRKLNGYCCHCFVNIFPDDPRALTVRKKSKEL